MSKTKIIPKKDVFKTLKQASDKFKKQLATKKVDSNGKDK